MKRHTELVQKSETHSISVTGKLHTKKIVIFRNVTMKPGTNALTYQKILVPPSPEYMDKLHMDKTRRTSAQLWLGQLEVA
jgi:hypothetical protein